ncbi:hypothetical protein PHET_03131 [Paragonimus heterotremus]|uniref:SERRATE/Ars2 N-terminal domain-containing protein n=1 Tax=Paragonimus heterotremus TaxID=100268 RepID=A0A8J4T0A3_9TREM|nr:hypothetical protein PHET_03131 [Paragonimus heterotremus]
MSLRKETTGKNLKRRRAVFMELYENGLFDNQSVQMDNNDNLIRLMDAAVTKLEGGTNEDLKVLYMNDRSRHLDEDESRQQTTSLPSTQASNMSTGGHKSEEGEAESDLDAEDSDKTETVDSTPIRTGVTDQPGRNDRENPRDRASSHDSAHSDRPLVAVAAAAAAALYPNAATATDLYCLAAGPRSGMHKPQRGNFPNSYGSRAYDGRRRQNSSYNKVFFDFATRTIPWQCFLGCLWGCFSFCGRALFF